MKKKKFQKLGIKKATISQLTQLQLLGGGTNTCEGHSCCPTQEATCADTCANTCANTCAETCGNGSGSAGYQTSRFCPTVQV